MKKILSLATLFALTMSLTLAQAQEQPKAAAKKEKAGCCSAAEKASCGEKASKASSKAKADCDMSKCGDDCKTHGADAKSKHSTDKKI